MATLEALMMRGVRSVGTADEDTHVIHFLNPLTIISGPNGTGKTTIIEALNFITTGQLPSGRLNTFLHSMQIARVPRVDAMVKLQFRDAKGNVCVATKRMSATVSKGGKMTCKSDEFNIQISQDGEKPKSLSSKVADFQKEMLNLLGCPSAILDNVIFCHQEESCWPLSEPKELKNRFDKIFQLTKFVKALDNMRKLKKEQDNELRVIDAKQKSAEMRLQQKLKLLSDQEIEEASQKEKIERIQILIDEINDHRKIYKETSDSIVKLNNSEQQCAIKKAELRVLRDQLGLLKVSRYPGTKDDLKAQIKQLEVSPEYRNVEKEKADLERRIQNSIKEIDSLKKQKAGIEDEMIHLRSAQMRIHDIENELIHLTNSIITKLNISREASITDQLTNHLEEYQLQLESMKQDEEQERIRVQKELDEVQSDCMRYQCEADGFESSAVRAEAQATQINNKLQMATSSQSQLSELTEEISSLENRLAELPPCDENKIAELREIRQNAQEKVDRLRIECKEAERYEDSEKELERKELEKTETVAKLDGLLTKHSDDMREIFGSEINGPWGDIVRSKATILNREATQAEEKCRRAELIADRTTQSLRQKQKEEQKVDRDAEELRQKIWDTSKCSPSEVDSRLDETKLSVTTVRKQLAPLDSQSILYESWSVEAVEKSCCPLCERRFASKAGAHDLAAKLRNIVESMPVESEKLSKELSIKEEEERQLFNAQIYVEQLSTMENDQLARIKEEIQSLEEKVASETKEVKILKVTVDSANEKKRNIQNILTDVSLMDSLFTKRAELEKEISDIKKELQKHGRSQSLTDLKDNMEKEEKIVIRAVADAEKLQIDSKERNQLTTELHKLRGHRITLGEAAAQSTHLQEQMKGLQVEAMEHRRKAEQMRYQLQQIQPRLMAAKNRRNEVDSSTRSAQHEVLDKMRDISDMRSKFDDLNTKKSSMNTNTTEMERCRSRLSAMERSISNEEKTRMSIEMKMNDIDGCQEKKRNLTDQLTKMIVEEQINSLESELEELEWKGESREIMQRRIKDLELRINKFESEKGKIKGQLEEIEKKLKECKTGLATREIIEAERMYRDLVIDKLVSTEVISDLEKYMTVLDDSIIQFHSDKMGEINEILDELWRKVYRGGDIESIKIKSDTVSSDEKRKSYDYRVVMLMEGGIEVDMRDRCSAGQKMLASILIRIALADVFGGMCSIIALDEPTTNLDIIKVEHLAEMLNDLIAAKRSDEIDGMASDRQFQMIIITHDERLVSKLKMGSRPEHIYILGKNDKGLSYVKKQYSDGTESNTTGSDARTTSVWS